MSDIHPNVVRVTAAAKERGLDIATKRFPEGTKTAADAAAAPPGVNKGAGSKGGLQRAKSMRMDDGAQQQQSPVRAKNAALWT